MLNIYRLYYLVIKNNYQEVLKYKDKTYRDFVGVSATILSILIGYRVYSDIFNNGNFNDTYLVIGIALMGLEFVALIIMQAIIYIHKNGINNSTRTATIVLLKTFLYVLLPCLIITLLIVAFAPR